MIRKQKRAELEYSWKFKSDFETSSSIIAANINLDGTRLLGETVKDVQAILWILYG